MSATDQSRTSAGTESTPQPGESGQPAPVFIEQRRLRRLIKDDAVMLGVTRAVRGTEFLPAHAELLAWLEQVGRLLATKTFEPSELQTILDEWRQRRAVWRRGSGPTLRMIAVASAPTAHRRRWLW